MSDEVIGAIIAGGQASRMGGVNKPLQVLAGQPMIAHVASRLRHQTPSIIVNANRDVGAIAVATRVDPSNVVADHPAFAARGPLSGLLASMRAAKSRGADQILTVAADTPFFPTDLAARLQNAADGNTIAIARCGGYRHPLFALWPTAIADDLEAFLAGGDINKVMAFAKRHALVEVDFDETGNDPFFNINTPEDLAKAEALFVVQVDPVA
ncbi:MAG: molybdenum cofactor guanylyltransferase MobA [Pseudomonadota bacterium]